MTESIEKIKKQIIELLDENNSRGILRREVENNLSNQYSLADVKKAISELVENFAIDLVIDYPSSDSKLDTGHPHWFLKTLSPTESQELRELSPLQLSLLRILQETDDEGFPSEVPVSEVRAKLIVDGYSKDDVEWLSITGKVYQVTTTREGDSVRCYMIIPEYEKTEEYRKFQEESELRATEKELRSMRLEDDEK